MGEWTMDKPAWTEGPWFVRERPTDDGLAVIEDGRANGLFPIKCEWGEAHLIAAAPDLYKALEDVVGWFTSWSPTVAEEDDWPAIKARVDAALAKARGETTDG
jgi:hypothetical protein